MAQHPDNQPGRMLFTDFDVSDKGRPVAVLAAAPAGPPADRHILDLAASLGLDFEDDEGDAPPAPGTAASAEAEDRQEHNATHAATVLPAPAGEDDELSLDQTGDILAEPWLPSLPPIMAPTWEEYTSSFRHNPAANVGGGSAEDSDVPAAPLPVPLAELWKTARDIDAADHATLAPTAAYDPITDGDDDLDILSFLSSEAIPLPQKKSKPPLAAPETPYGGVERIDNWFEPPENQPEPHPASRDWFEPPEEGETAERPPSSRDWFEPPEDAAAHDPDKTAAFDPVAADTPDAAPDANPDATAGASGGTHFIFRRKTDAGTGTTAKKKTPGESDADIFAGIDIDATWNRLVEENKSRRSESDTRSLDLFDDVDLDSVWQERQGRRYASDTTMLFAENMVHPEQTKSEDRPGAKTDILKNSLLSASDTVIMTRDDWLGGLTAASPGADADDPADLLTSLDAIGAGALSPAAEEDDGATGSYAAAPAEDEEPTGSFMPVDDDDGIVHGIEPPVVSDADIEGPARKKGTVAISGARVMGDGAPSGDGALDDLGEIYPPESADAALSSPTGRRSASAGESADDAESSADGVAAGISAPAIDDADIDSSRPRPRSGTEEIAAIADNPFPDSFLDDTAAEGEGGEEGEAEAVSVNPMDVFANMDDMDFSDDMDDDMRAMLEAEEEPAVEAAGEAGAAAGSAAAVEALPTTRLGKAWHTLTRLVKRVVPVSAVNKVNDMVAWRENWWFYCDLVAALIASASLAVILSYYIWFRE